MSTSEACGAGQDCLVVCVQRRTEKEDGGDAADDVGEPRGFVRLEWAAKQEEFAR